MNRRQRRAEQNSSSNIKSANDIPLSHPPPSANSNQSKPKTLLEIAAERQAQLQPNSTPFNPLSNATNGQNIVTVKVDSDGTVIPDSTNSFLDSSNTLQTTTQSTSLSQQPDELINPWLDTLLLSTSLSAVHFTLSVLAMHQYAQSLTFPPLITQTLFTAFPTLTFLIHLFHGHLFPSSLLRSLSSTTKTWVIALRQLTYLVVANVAGCYLIQTTNDRGYYAVMKNAPSIGTIWVWSVLEMGVVGALLGVAGPGMWAWWRGYGIW